MNEYVTPIIAVVGTIFGGAGLKLTEKWLSKSKDKDDTATALRSELRAELTGLKKELSDVETELDTWKEKYYTLLQQYIDTKAQLESALRQIQDTIDNQKE